MANHKKKKTPEGEGFSSGFEFFEDFDRSRKQKIDEKIMFSSSGKTLQGETGSDLSVHTEDLNAPAELKTIRTAAGELSSDPPRLVGASSVIGKRESQQDALGSSDLSVTENFKEKWIGVLCDGMGGMSGGEQASTVSVDIALDAFSKYDGSAGEAVPVFYQKLIDSMDYKVSSLEDESGRYLGAGTTFVSVLIDSGKAFWASVGDSHIYIIRGGQMQMVVSEHNYLRELLEMVKNQEISSEEAYAHKSKDALTSYIGMGGVALIDINDGEPLYQDDIFVLCSDGLYRALSDEEIRSIVLANTADMQKAADTLTTAALAKNLPYQDNTSVITIKYK